MDDRLKPIAQNFEKMKIGIDEPFKFSCTMCGLCCRGRSDILLNPKDLFKIAQGLGITPREAVEKYCEVYIGQSSRIPIVRLVPVGPYKICQLLNGNRCSVHNSKPTVCALYPLGRAVEVSKKATDNVEISPKDIKYILQPISCGGRKTEHTVREWLEKFNIPVEDEFFARWQTIVCKVGSAVRKLEKTASEEFMSKLLSLIFVGLYLDYSMKTEFEEQLEINSKKVVGFIESVIDMFGKQN